MQPYLNQTAVLATKHQKLGLVAPALKELAGLEVASVEVDTDQLGTFSPETPRTSSVLETAIAKARMGMAVSGQSIGLASEGSIGPDPQNPFLVSDIETLVLVDDERGIVIHESHRSFEITARRLVVKTTTDLGDFLSSVDFPAQRLIAYPASNPKAKILKGISSKRQLTEAISELARLDAKAEVVLETDFRAHQSPTRQANITRASELLALRLNRLCPACEAPGFGKIDYQRGLNCEGCGSFDELAIASELLRCVKCERFEPGKEIAKSLKMEHCDFCNP